MAKNFKMIVNEPNTRLIDKVKVLLCNSSSRNLKCGIYQYGLSISEILISSSNEDIKYIYGEASSYNEFMRLVNKETPDVVIFNCNKATMPWLTYRRLFKVNFIKILFSHDLNNFKSTFFNPIIFDYVIPHDFSLDGSNPYVLKVGKFYRQSDLIKPSLLNYSNLENKITVGSFGLALPGKGFAEIIKIWQEKYIGKIFFRFHLPRSDVMDVNGFYQKNLIAEIKSAIDPYKSTLEISTEFLSKKDLVNFLAGNDVNIFNYENERGGDNQTTAVFEYALSASRPFLVSNCRMFKNILDDYDYYFNFNNFKFDSSMKEYLSRNIEAQNIIRSEWTSSGFLIDINNAVKYAALNYKNRPNIFKLYKMEIKNFIRQFLPRSRYKYLSDIFYKTLAVDQMPKWTEIKNNIILDYEVVSKILKHWLIDINKICKNFVHIKISESLVQHAYAANLIAKNFKPNPSYKMLCVGSYGDILVPYLRAYGYVVIEIDPNINYTLSEYIARNQENLRTFDCVFSISVLEHIQDDFKFIKECKSLLKKGGLFIATVDFKNKIDDWLPSTHIRFYDKKRLIMLLDDNNIIFDNNWGHSSEAFKYNGTYYSFASVVFKS
jgi:SAM-dependent methyltransferase